MAREICVIQEDHHAGERPNYLVLHPGGCTWLPDRRLAARFGAADTERFLAYARNATKRPLVVVPVESLDVVDVLRERGWSVAVHNDYRLRGERQTFWLFTCGSRCVKGEGPTDAVALSLVEDAINELEEGLRP